MTLVISNHDFCIQQGQGCAKAHGAVGCWCGWGQKPGPVAPVKEPETPKDHLTIGDRWIRERFGAYLVAALLVGALPAMAQNIGWPSNTPYRPPILNEYERSVAACFRDMPWVMHEEPWVMHEEWLGACVARHLDDKRTMSPAGHQR